MSGWACADADAEVGGLIDEFELICWAILSAVEVDDSRVYTIVWRWTCVKTLVGVTEGKQASSADGSA